MTPILTEKISNHPEFTDVERYVDVTMQTANSGAQTFEFCYEIRYMRSGVDVSTYFSQPLNNKIMTDSNTKILLRDEDFCPIPNPEWDGVSEDEYDKYLWVYGWDMIMDLINQPTNIAEMIRNYIQINDAENYFDN